MGIITTIPTNLDFPNRGVLERDDFVNAQETAQDLLAGAYTTALNQYATELNDTEADINLKWEQVQNQAVTGGYSQAYIDATFTPKILNTQIEKITPVDADLIPLSDSVSSFGLKKLSWANAKSTFKTYFDTLYVALSSNQSIDGVKTFTSSPIVPTLMPQDNSTKIATTAYVDGKMVLSTAVNTTSGTAIDFTAIPSWVKKITIMFDDVKLSGSSSILVKVGNGSIISTGYKSSASRVTTQVSTISSTSGFVTSINIAGGSEYFSGEMHLSKINGNKWTEFNVGGQSATGLFAGGGVSPELASALDMIRITTVNGTDTFTAGQVNIRYEG